MGASLGQDAGGDTGSVVRGEEKGLHQETTFSPELLQHMHLVLPTAPVCPPHAWHCAPGPCAGIGCIFVFFCCQGGALFLLCFPGPGAGAQWAQMGSEGHGGSGRRARVSPACGAAHEPNKTSRPFAHSRPFLYLSLIKLCKEML